VIASEVSFKQMMIGARNNENLSVLSSYIQVEHGLKTLEACWDGFVHVSEDMNRHFKNKKDVCTEFAKELRYYLDFADESAPFDLGQEIPEDC